MDDSLSRGLPFELADLWRRSAFQLKDEDQTLFAPLEASFPSLDLEPKRKDLEHELSIPPPDALETDSQHLETPEGDIASPPSELWDTGQPSHGDGASVWDLDLNLDLPPEKPRLHTWEAFEKKSVPNAERTAYLSEAGPGAFDAVLAKRAGKSNGVLPQDAMLSALCNLALGRASVFFQWDESKAAFTRTLEDVPISGYSPAACDSFVGWLMRYATLYRSLRSMCASTISKRQNLPSMVALNGCLFDILDGVEERITNQVPQMRSILQLQALIEAPHQLLDMLDKIAQALKAASSDEALISAVADYVHETVSADSYLGGVLRLVLDRTSMPWLERLAADFGLRDDLTIAEDANPDKDEPDAEFGSSSLSARAPTGEMAGFMSVDDRKMVQDAKASLRILRKTLGARTVDEMARKLCNNALATHTRDAFGVDSNATPTASGKPRSHEPLTETEGQAWADATLQHDFIARIDAQISGPPEHLAVQDERLRSAVLSYCESREQGLDLTDTDSLNENISPFYRLRSALELQSRHLNRTLLRHLFTNGLVHHLHLQHCYHFLTSGEFVTRLSTALFSAETQSAERKRDTIPTGQTMGLRLGAARTEQRWPPASSELRLTLMDVLTETYKADFPPTPGTELVKGSKELPGGLSFSIRELQEEEIERVMDPSSIYALDFLRLQYSAPAPLDAVLTATSMQVYDSVFRQLLRALRAVCVSTALAREVARRGRQNETDDHGALARGRMKFAQQAHSFTTTLFSHLVDLGIARPWRSLSRKLQLAEQSLEDDRAMPTSLETLRQMHTACLDTTRRRLFLRQKQEKIKLAIEDVLTAVLAGASALEGNSEDQTGELEKVFSGFDGAVKTLLKLLSSTVDKPPKMRTTNGMMNDYDDEDGIECIRTLLVRLDWNGYYHDESKERK